MELDKDKLVNNMTDNLQMLRARLGMTQEELADKIGLSRSTVHSMESRKTRMTWNTFLSLVLVFIKNEETDKLLNILEIYTDELHNFLKDRNVVKEEEENVLSQLDPNALASIKQTIIGELARCKDITADEAIRFFEGNKFLTDMVSSDEDQKIKNALNNIKENK